MTEISSTVSGAPNNLLSSVPGAGCWDVRMSSPSSPLPRPSSSDEHSMPAESTSRSFETLISKPPGITVPGSATGTRSPALKFLAPQTIWRGLPSPTSTRQTLRRSADGCFSNDTISPTTTRGSGARPKVWTDSTSSPSIGSTSARRSVVTPERSTWRESAWKETFMA